MSRPSSRAAEDIGAGCGCAYPETVDDGVVRALQRDPDAIARRARRTARARLRGLPMHLVAQVGALRVGIVHGDAASLAGWRFAPDALDDAAQTALAGCDARAVANRRLRLHAHLPGRACAILPATPAG